MKLRIRHKLAFWMTIIGIIPSFIASFMAISLIVGRLKTNKRQETAKTLRIGTNLIMDHVESIKKVTLGLSKHRTTFLFFNNSELSYQNRRLLLRELEGLGNGVLHVLEASGRLTGSLVVGEPPSRMSEMDLELQYEKSLEQSQQMISQVLNEYAHTVDIISITRDKGKPTAKELLFVRAAAPILDKQYNLKGAIVVTMALDELFCQNISTILGSHIILFPFHGDPYAHGFGRQYVSSFQNFTGRKETTAPISDATLAKYIKEGREAQLTETSYHGTKYSVAMNSLHNIKGDDQGIFVIATDIDTIQKGQAEAIFTLKWITVMSLAVAVLLALLFARSLSRPLGRLLTSVQDVARGKLETNIKSNSTDEIGDLAKGFNKMVRELRGMRQKQTEQISEIQTLHEINGAISVQVGLENVIVQAMRSIGIAVQCDNAIFWFRDETGTFVISYKDGPRWKDLKNVAKDGKPLYKAAIQDEKLRYIKKIDDSKRFTRLGKLKGEVMIIPLFYQGQPIAVVSISRDDSEVKWSEVHFRILRTVADQLAVYIVNAQMFETISSFNEELEQMVQNRTVELKKANVRLEDTLNELKDTQVQVLISERLAGLGSLLAGVAHEINSPIGAIDAAVENLRKNIRNFIDNLLIISDSDDDIQMLTFMLTVMVNYLDDYTPSYSQDQNQRPRVRTLAGILKEKGVANHRNIARKFVDLKADTHLMEFISHYDASKVAIYIQFMYDMLSINKSASSVAMAIQSVKRIVVALRSYSHVKQDIPEWTNIHDVIETSLIILANKLKHRINVVKNYGDIPPVRVYGDELSQVWTNIIMNAAQAIEGEGTITIATEIKDPWLVVSISDTGPGIPEKIQKKIFDAFFTTKKKGEGSGLGLGIVSRIVNQRHKGRIELDSVPGSTTFRIFLPLSVELDEEVPEGTKEES